MATTDDRVTTDDMEKSAVEDSRPMGIFDRIMFAPKGDANLAEVGLARKLLKAKFIEAILECEKRSLEYQMKAAGMIGWLQSTPLKCVEKFDALEYSEAVASARYQERKVTKIVSTYEEMFGEKYA